MQIEVGGWAWLRAADLSPSQKEYLRRVLTVYPRKIADYDDGDDSPILLYREEDSRFGVAREFFLQKQKSSHDVRLLVSSGDKSHWPGDFPPFNGTLRLEQEQALLHVLGVFSNGTLGGIVKAPPGWGKTVWACSLMARMNVPSLIVVHKEFLVDQWVKRILNGDPDKNIPPFLPGAEVGIVQRNRCDFYGKHIAVGMVHSLVSHDYPDAFFRWPGLVIFDETHRVAAKTWSRVPPRFAAKYRIGLSATPRRKDGAEAVFFYHIGKVLFEGKERRLTPSIRRVTTNFRIVRTPNFNPTLVKLPLLLRFMCANEQRNQLIINQLVLAVQAGRKIMVMSHRLNHLKRLHEMFTKTWKPENGSLPSVGYHVGGMSESDRESAARCCVVFATVQYVSEALDIPDLDTLFLTTPMSDIEQAVGRILRPYEGKKNPIVVDFIDQYVRFCVDAAEARERQYKVLMKQKG